MSSHIEHLVERAEQLANSGHWEEAERVWQEIHERDPKHLQALFSLSVHAFDRGDVASACDLLRAARAVAPNNVLVLMMLGAACRQHGDVDAEREAIDAALAIDPHFLPALLSRASWIERFSDPTAAAIAYLDALAAAPSAQQWPAALRPKLEHAQAVVKQYSMSYRTDH